MSRDLLDDLEPRERSAMYDHARRRRSKRSGRERGCWTYVSADELQKAGIDPDEPSPPDYRVWGGPRGGVVIQFYKPQPTDRRDTMPQHVAGEPVSPETIARTLLRERIAHGHASVSASTRELVVNGLPSPEALEALEELALLSVDENGSAFYAVSSNVELAGRIGRTLPEIP